MMTPEQTGQYLHSKIPISAAMGVKVVEASEDRLVLEAPLEANHNHLGTAFGGSLNTLATLAAYAFLFRALDDMAAHLVIAKSSIRFLRPVRHDLRAVCPQPGAAKIAAFKEQYEREGKARMRMSVTLEQEGMTKPAVQFTGTFVSLRSSSNGA